MGFKTKDAPTASIFSKSELEELRVKAAEIKEMMERMNTPARVSSRRHELFADILEPERRVEWVSESPISGDRLGNKLQVRFPKKDG